MNFHFPGGNCPRLVQTQYVHSCQSFHAIHILRQSFVTGKSYYAYAENRARQRRKPARYHSDESSYGVYDGGVQVPSLHHVFNTEKRNPEWHDDSRHNFDYQHQRPPDCGVGFFEIFCAGTDFHSKVVQSDMNNPGFGFARNNGAAAHDFVADVFVDGVRLAGYKRLVDLDVSFYYHGVRAYLISRRKHGKIVQQNFLDRGFGLFSAPYYFNFRGGNQRKFIHRALCPKFLQNSYARIYNY